VIYPAKLDITILQNSTFKAVFRALQKQQAITAFTVISGNPIFTVPCHGLIAGDKVVIVPPGDAEATLPAPAAPEAPDVPCGLTLNQVYFVSATGLTNSAFTVSATNGGAAITVANTALDPMVVAQPVDLAGYTADADVKGLADDLQKATFTCALETAADGLVNITMAPATTAGMEVGRYGWDASLTSSAGERYYWLQGVATVAKTYSRNS
jgi:hypothetical protein